MNDFAADSLFFGVFISLLSYGIGVFLKKRLKWSICNPLLISIIITILVLIVCKIDYQVYYEGAKYLSYLLTPATVCLAIPLYEQIERLKEHLLAVVLGLVSGVLTSLGSILAMCVMLHMNHQQYVTLLPKSITTAIGMGISEELGGYVAITIAVIIMTGVLGNMIADVMFRIFSITDPVAKGIALGSSSHAIGTAKAMELGEIEGAMSSLSIVAAGLLTVVLASVAASLY